MPPDPRLRGKNAGGRDEWRTRTSACRQQVATAKRGTKHHRLTAGDRRPTTVPVDWLYLSSPNQPNHRSNFAILSDQNTYVLCDIDRRRLTWFQL